MVTKITLDGKLSTGVSTKLLPVDGAKVEICEIPSASYDPGSHVIQIKHEKEGYNAYLLFCPQYGIADGLFAYVKSQAINTVGIYVQNRNEEAVTMSLGETIWLCIPILVDDENG